MRKTIILKPHEAAALARGETITIWRPCNPQPEFCGAEGEQNDINQWGWMTDETPSFLPVSNCNPFPLNVPLLGKEAFDGCETDKIRYKADGGPAYNDNGRGVNSWKPSIHMPEWAVRTLVTLSDVRVRKPCDVTEEEAKAMGVSKYPWMATMLNPDTMKIETDHAHCQRIFRERFATLYGDLSLYHWSYTATPTKKQPE